MAGERHPGRLWLLGIVGVCLVSMSCATSRTQAPETGSLQPDEAPAKSDAEASTEEGAPVAAEGATDAVGYSVSTEDIGSDWVHLIIAREGEEVFSTSLAPGTAHSFDEQTGRLEYTDSLDIEEACGVEKVWGPGFPAWLASCWPTAQKAYPALAETPRPDCNCEIRDPDSGEVIDRLGEFVLARYRIELGQEGAALEVIGFAGCGCAS